MRPFVVALGLLLAAVVAVDLVAITKRHQLAPRERMLSYMPPYHPAAWEVLKTDPRPLERVTNFSDPASVPCAEADFFNSSHQTAECLSRIFWNVADGVVR